MCAFLSYVTHETLQGREARISAYSVAVDALNKPADFDPQMDPSVRVLAKRLRDSLAKYYEEESDYDVQVILTPGSYVPSFSHVRQPNQKTATYRSSPWTTPVLCFEADEWCIVLDKRTWLVVRFKPLSYLLTECLVATQPD